MLKSAMNFQRTGCFLLLAIMLIYACDAALAQNPLGVGAAETSAGPAYAGGVLGWINQQQQAFFASLRQAVIGMRSDPGALWPLIGLSFAYGVFHAAGPGHGKAVISSYMVANEVALRRGVILSFISAFLQGLSALVLVGLVYVALRRINISMNDATSVLEKLSYGLVAVFGAWLLFRKLSALRRHKQSLPHTRDAVAPCATCGHNHAPPPEALSDRTLDWKAAASAVIAVGLRPCSGAILVLGFALLNGLYMGGVLSVFAMAIGTAITVSILATLAVSAKNIAVRFSGESHAGIINSGVEIAGAVCVMTIGLLLLAASL